MGNLIWILLEIHCSLQQWKNFANRSRIDKVIAMDRVAPFFDSQCIAFSVATFPPPSTYWATCRLFLVFHVRLYRISWTSYLPVGNYGDCSFDRFAFVQQLTRFQQTQRVARSLCSSWASCQDKPGTSDISKVTNFKAAKQISTKLVYLMWDCGSPKIFVGGPSWHQHFVMCSGRSEVHLKVNANTPAYRHIVLANY